MNEHININQESVRYDVDREDGSVACNKTVSMWIFGKKKCFHGSGIAHCIKENIFNESFGQTLAEIRTNLDVLRQIEISLVKYTFDHFVKEEITNNHRTEELFEEIIKEIRRNKQWKNNQPKQLVK